jgi:hypothetical protein
MSSGTPWRWLVAEWKKICCAIDFSEPSHLAMEEAAGLVVRAVRPLARSEAVRALPD